MHRLEKVIKLFPKGRGEEVTIPIPANKALILTISFTNRRFAQQLSEQGIPLIADESPEDTRTKFLIKKTQIALRTGASPRLHLTPDRGIIEKIGRALRIPKDTTISGREILSRLCDIAQERGITQAFLRIRQRTTEVGLTRLKKGMVKFNTKIYFIQPDKVNFKGKRGTRRTDIDKLPEVLWELLEAVWFIHVYDNPDSVVVALTTRQPQGQPSHTLSLP